MEEREIDWNETDESPAVQGFEVEPYTRGDGFELIYDGQHLSLMTVSEARDLMLALGAALGYEITKEV